MYHPDAIYAVNLYERACWRRDWLRIELVGEKAKRDSIIRGIIETCKSLQLTFIIANPFDLVTDEPVEDEGLMEDLDAELEARGLA